MNFWTFPRSKKCKLILSHLYYPKRNDGTFYKSSKNNHEIQITVICSLLSLTHFYSFNNFMCGNMPCNLRSICYRWTKKSFSYFLFSLNSFQVTIKNQSGRLKRQRKKWRKICWAVMTWEKIEISLSVHAFPTYFCRLQLPYTYWTLLTFHHEPTLVITFRHRICFRKIASFSTRVIKIISPNGFDP